MEKVIDPKTGRVVHASRATAERLRKELGASDEASGSDSAQPAKSATREEWNDYAESIGLDPEEYGSKGELIEAVEAA